MNNMWEAAGRANARWEDASINLAPRSWASTEVMPVFDPSNVPSLWSVPKAKSDDKNSSRPTSFFDGLANEKAENKDPSVAGNTKSLASIVQNDSELRALIRSLQDSKKLCGAPANRRSGRNRKKLATETNNEQSHTDHRQNNLLRHKSQSTLFRHKSDIHLTNSYGTHVLPSSEPAHSSRLKLTFPQQGGLSSSSTFPLVSKKGSSSTKSILREGKYSSSSLNSKDNKKREPQRRLRVKFCSPTVHHLAHGSLEIDEVMTGIHHPNPNELESVKDQLEGGVTNDVDPLLQLQIWDQEKKERTDQVVVDSNSQSTLQLCMDDLQLNKDESVEELLRDHDASDDDPLLQ